MDTKKCSKCKEIKNVGEFYKRSVSLDGLNSACKGCNRITMCKYQQSNKGKTSRKSYNTRNSEKTKARSCLYNAIRSGTVVRPNNCDKCGKVCKTEAHHHSYLEEYRLDVQFLCRQCHINLHNLNLI